MRLGHIRRAFPAVIAVALLVPASQARADRPLHAAGTGTALGAMRRLAAAFAEASPGDRVEVLASLGSSGAVKAVAQGALDLGLVGRDLTAGEKALGVAAVPYARTPFVFVAGPRSRASGVTAEEVARIYRGEQVSWPSGERVRLILRPKMDADTILLHEISREMAEAVELASKREGMLWAATNQDCNQMAARTPGALAPTSLTQLLTENEPLIPLTWNGVAPTLPNLASGAYPLAKTLQVVVHASPRPAVRRFLAFLGSEKARRVLEETGNLPLPPPALP